MKATLYSIDGAEKGSIELPPAFSEPVRSDLIARAVMSELSEGYQPKSPYRWAGLQTSAGYRGRKEAYRSLKNKGVSRLPREKLPKGRYGKVRKIPFAVGGRRAHPPRVDKILIEKINDREKKKAMRSALAATVVREIVEKRGHKLGGVKNYPLVIENSFEALAKTKAVIASLEKLGFSADLERARHAKRMSGVIGNRRGGTKRPKSLLIVVGEDKGIGKGGRNIAGVDVVLVDKLSARLLAPGTHAGRATVYTEGALGKLKNW